VVGFADGGEVAAHTVVLATGVSYHTLDAPGIKQLTGRGVFYGSAATEAPACADQDVHVVGGANAAGQAAVFLARHARQVTLLVRADGLERSMSHYLIRQIRDTANIAVRPSTTVAGAEGDEHLSACGSATPPPGRSRRCRRSVRVHRGGTLHRTGSTAVERDQRGFRSPAPTRSRRPAATRLAAF
jgi:thioredoxin reductase (NADPH)